MKKMKYLRMLILMVGLGVSVSTVSASNLNSGGIYTKNTVQKPATVKSKKSDKLFENNKKPSTTVNQGKNAIKINNERIFSPFKNTQRKQMPSNFGVFNKQKKSLINSKELKKQPIVINQGKNVVKMNNERLPEKKNTNNKNLRLFPKNTQQKTSLISREEEKNKTFNKKLLEAKNINNNKDLFLPSQSMKSAQKKSLINSKELKKQPIVINQEKNVVKMNNERLPEKKNTNNKNLRLFPKNTQQKTPLVDKNEEKVVKKTLPNIKDMFNIHQLKKQKNQTFKSFKEFKQMMNVNKQNDVYIIDENISDEYKSKYPSYPSAKYYELCQKSKFFKSVNEKLFNEKYNKEYNNNNFLWDTEALIISNVRNNLYNKDKDFKFVTGLQEKQKNDAIDERKKNKLENIKSKTWDILKNINSSFKDAKEKLNNLVEVFDPQYKTIKINDICFYCYSGFIIGYRNLINGKYYYIDNTEYNPNAISPYKKDIQYADTLHSKYDLVLDNDNEIKYRIGNNIFDVINENGKIWYSLNGIKKFFSIQGARGYISLDRGANLTLNNTDITNINDIPYNNILPEKFFNKAKNKGEYAEDPQYEVVNSDGDTIYFFEGLPRYVKLKKGYYNIKNNKIYSRLPIVNADYFWDKEYEVIKRDDKLFYYVDAKPVYEITQKQIPNSNETLLTYSPVLKNNPNGESFTSIKGKRDYCVRKTHAHGNSEFMYIEKLPYLG